VDLYLRTTLGQLELIRAEAPAAREQMELAKRARAQSPPSTPRARRPKTPQAVWSDFVDATFVRSARKLGYRPAELLYVRDRFAAVSGSLMASEAHAFKDDGAALFRQQAEMMRGTPGVTQAQIDMMLQAADRAEHQAVPKTPPRLVQNLAVLRQAHAGLSDDSWGRITGVAAGVEVSDLGQLPETEASRRLDDLRELHLGALENRNPGT
jgi:hypothetical protein